MDEKRNQPRYPTNWGVRFLCDCKKHEQDIRIHKGVAQEISTDGVSLLSDHHICEQKRVAMQLMIPSMLNGAQEKMIKIIGNSVTTIVKEGKFLTHIEFLHFEEDGLKELEKNLLKRFDQQFFATAAKRA